MPDYTEIKNKLSRIESLERELNLKQLQINRLLNITQAINNNVSAEGLFSMYQSFLGWEIGINKMMLYIKEEEDWVCPTHIGIDEKLTKLDITDMLPKYTRLKNLEKSDHPLIQEFDVVIPVKHKEMPIAYVFIGGFSEEEDMYSKVQFITTITNVIAVAIENKRLFKRQLEQERLKREMELASDMQRMLIPKILPKTSCYELASIYQPQLGVGGDYFDFIESEDGKIIFCVGDISGKGLAAALLMANFQAIFHTLLHKRTSLKEFVVDLNKSVNLITRGDRFITLFVAEYDKKTKKLSYVNAGHYPPLWVAAGEVTSLRKGCTILGPFEELPEIEVGHVQLETDEALILTFTDGLTDLQNEHGAYFGEPVLNEFAAKHYRSSAYEFNTKLMAQIEKFRGKQAFPDDITILTCKVYNTRITDEG